MRRNYVTIADVIAGDLTTKAKVAGAKVYDPSEERYVDRVLTTTDPGYYVIVYVDGSANAAIPGDHLLIEEAQS